MRSITLALLAVPCCVVTCLLAIGGQLQPPPGPVQPTELVTTGGPAPAALRSAFYAGTLGPNQGSVVFTAAQLSGTSGFVLTRVIVSRPANATLEINQGGVTLARFSRNAATGYTGQVSIDFGVGLPCAAADIVLKNADANPQDAEVTLIGYVR